MMQGSAALALWIDIDPASRDECDTWYVEKHIADRIALPGWRRARRFRAEPGTAPATLALYEVEQAGQLVADAYLRLQSEVDARDLRMRASFRNVVRGTFRVARSIGQGEGGVMLSLRFLPDATRETDETALRWLIDTLIPRIAALAGVVGVHLLIGAPELRAQHDGHRKSGNTDAHAHRVLLVEATEVDRIDPVRLLLEDTAGVLNSDDKEVGIYRLMYAISG
ncbi:MAG: hypothetical protein JWQ23_3529 [Herminiimonas sp.]|nr:hypothetical protein [Herminiimonas sp.]